MWRSLTDDDLRSAISAAEEASFRTKLLGEGQADPFAVIFAQVTKNFRDAIRANPANELDPDEATLPEGAIFHAVAIVRHRLCGRFNAGEQTETRRDEYKEATAWLKAVPSGPPVEPPGTATAVKKNLPAPAVNQSPRRDGWRDQDGI